MKRTPSPLLAMLTAGFVLLADGSGEAIGPTACAAEPAQPPVKAGSHEGTGHDRAAAPAATNKQSSDHGEGDDDEHGRAIKLTAQQLSEFGIEVGSAGPGPLDVAIELPAEIAFNEDRLAHVTPRVPGIVTRVDKTLGDPVRAGDTLAVMQSRELAEAKAAYLANVERLTLARANFERESGLWRAKVTAEQEYLEVKQALAEAEIEKRSSEQKLHALGFDDRYIERLPRQPEADLTIVPLLAPLGGVIVERHATQGERISEDAPAFIIADLNSVWLNISVYPKDLARVRIGQELTVTLADGEQVRGKIRFIAPNVGEETRTARALAVLDNAGGRLRPGSFVTARVAVDSQTARVRVPKTALQTHDGNTVVFVATEDGFLPRPVTTGGSNGDYVEITGGLAKGERYVQTGAFTLKAQTAKATFGDGHGH